MLFLISTTVTISAEPDSLWGAVGGHKGDAFLLPLLGGSQYRKSDRKVAMNSQHQQSAAEVPSRPLSYRVERHFKTLENTYGRNQNAQGIKKFVEKVEAFCEAEIAAGRVDDTPDFWVTVYSRLLMSVSAKSNSLIWQGAHHSLLTGGLTLQKGAQLAEEQRAFRRLRAAMEDKLQTARKHAEVGKAVPVGAVSKKKKEEVSCADLFPRSARQQRLCDYLRLHRNASDEECLKHLLEHFPNSIPNSWKEDPSSIGKTVTKVRRKLHIPRRKSVNRQSARR
jgi:hypothetical protein